MFRVLGPIDDPRSVVGRLESGRWTRVSSAPHALFALSREHGIEEVGLQYWESAGVYLRSWDREDETSLEAWDPRARTWRVTPADVGSLAAHSEARSVRLAELAAQSIDP